MSAVLVSRTHTGSGLTLVYRVGAQRYRVQIHGSGKNRYAVIQTVSSHQASGLPSPDVGSVAAAVRQELTNLARTGGGALGRLAQSRMLPPILLLLSLVLLFAGLAMRRFARAMA